MPARTGKTTYVPGVGAATSGKSGKAKTFAGKGSGPAGTKKVAEKSYDEVPTVTVTDSGVSTSGFGSQKAASRAKRAQRTRVRRVRRIVNQVERNAAKRSRQSEPPKREEDWKFTKEQLHPSDPTETGGEFDRRRRTERLGIEKAAEQKVIKPEGPTAAIRRQEVIDARAFAKEQKRPMPRVVRRKAPKPGAKRIKREYRQAKRVSGRGPLRSPIVQTPEQAKIVRKVLRVGEHVGASRKEKLAALVTGAQETGFKNLAVGDNFTHEPAGGWRGERVEYYENPNNVREAAKEFFREAKDDTGGRRGAGESIGDFAQTIQQSAYEGDSTYGKHVTEARSLLRQYNQGKTPPKVARKLKRIEGEAQEKGINLKAVGKAPKKVVTRFKAIKAWANKIEKMEIPYNYGGGHGVGVPDPSEGLDCSSSTVYLLNKAGVKTPNIVSGQFGEHFPAGTGAVTIFYNSGHVFLRIGNKYFGTSTGNGGGLGYHDPPSESYLSEYSVAHVPGLGKKQALQLGIKPSETQSFPGMTLSSSGTSATINSGAGATVGKPGFSKRPIKLTPQQKYRRTARRLKAVGVGESAPSEEPSPTLKSLEQKYGVVA